MASCSQREDAHMAVSKTRKCQQAVLVKFGSLEVFRSQDTYLFVRNLEGESTQSLGVSNDLRAFVENRLTSGMTSSELIASLQQLRKFGEAHQWSWDDMDAAKRH